MGHSIDSIPWLLEITRGQPSTFHAPTTHPLRSVAYGLPADQRLGFATESSQKDLQLQVSLLQLWPFTSYKYSPNPTYRMCNPIETTSCNWYCSHDQNCIDGFDISSRQTQENMYHMYLSVPLTRGEVLLNEHGWSESIMIQELSIHNFLMSCSPQTGSVILPMVDPLLIVIAAL